MNESCSIIPCLPAINNKQLIKPFDIEFIALRDDHVKVSQVS